MWLDEWLLDAGKLKNHALVTLGDVLHHMAGDRLYWLKWLMEMEYIEFTTTDRNSLTSYNNTAPLSKHWVGSSNVEGDRVGPILGQDIIWNVCREHGLQWEAL